jgi:hypothetical protein
MSNSLLLVIPCKEGLNVAGTQELPPIHPNQVMVRAILTGLSTAVELMRIIKTEATQHLYELSKKNLEEVKKVFDVSINEDYPMKVGSARYG